MLLCWPTTIPNYLGGMPSLCIFSHTQKANSLVGGNNHPLQTTVAKVYRISGEDLRCVGGVLS